MDSTSTTIGGRKLQLTIYLTLFLKKQVPLSIAAAYCLSWTIPLVINNFTH